MRYCSAQNLLQNYYDFFKCLGCCRNRGRQGSSSNGESRICHEFCHLCDDLTAIDKISLILVLLLHIVSSLKYMKFSSNSLAVPILLASLCNIKPGYAMGPFVTFFAT